jgi:hypothetical protein
MYNMQQTGLLQDMKDQRDALCTLHSVANQVGNVVEQARETMGGPAQNTAFGRDTFNNFEGQKTGVEMHENEDDFNCRDSPNQKYGILDDL